jgi:hypothetical protein
LADLIQIAFEGVLLTIAGFLGATYVAFLKMNPEVRRARLFIMSARILRFLLAFVVGFSALAIDLLAVFVGIPVPPAVSMVVIFLFLGAVAYGSLELLLIARPPGQWLTRLKSSVRTPQAGNRNGPG